MPLPLLAAGKAAMTLAPFAMGAFQRGGKKINWGGYERWMNGIRPDGYLTDADLASGEATRARGVRAASDTAGNLRTEAMRRIRARGMATAGASEATLSRVDQVEGRMKQHAGDQADEQLANVRLGNQRFAQSKAMALIGARLNDAVRGKSMGDAKQATFMNSLIEYAPAALGSLDKIMGAKGVTAPARKYNPATRRFEIVDPGALDFNTEGDYETDFVDYEGSDGSFG